MQPKSSNATGLMCQTSATCETSQRNQSLNLFGCLQAAFHANLSRSQGFGVLLRTSGISGRSAAESWASYDRASHSLRTSQGCLLPNEDGATTECCLTWPRSGMMLSGTAYPLPPLASPTNEIGRGYLWSTPTATMPMEAESPNGRIRILPSGRPRKISRKGTDGSMNWCQLALHNGVSPTPNLCEWFMGYPDGWTDITLLETPSCHKSLN